MTRARSTFCLRLAVVMAGLAAEAGAQTSALLVNECASGPTGWIELKNTGTTRIDLATDPGRCYFVDDAAAGGPPKRLGDTNVGHASGSTTCSSLGRPASCAAVAPGERVFVGYAYTNAVTADKCRLVTSPRSGSTCGTTYTEASVGTTTSTAQGQCFGRQPDGGAWAAGPLPCTKGAPNATTAPAGPPTIARAGRLDRVLLRGRVVMPDTVLTGELYLEGDTIRCVAASCPNVPADATIVDTHGILFPGLIDTHNHIQFDIFDETDWVPPKVYTNHNQWTTENKYSAMVDAKQYLNGEYGSPVSLGCELVKYGELKALVSGTTSVVGAATPTNKSCYGTLARTIDQSANGLGSDDVQAATLFPSTSTADSVCRNLGDQTTDGYLIHIAEGTDDTAWREFAKLFTISTTDGCLYSSKTSIVHGTALGEPELDTMRQKGMGLVWSPRSNVFLYGQGLDLTKTTNIPAALERQITVALAPDWSIGGSQNLLDELRFADHVDDTKWGDAISPRTLVDMVTMNPAKLLGLGDVLGSLAPGKKADLVVLRGDASASYGTLLAATPLDVQLVFVGGVPLYGAPEVRALAPATPGCEEITLCGQKKFLCVAKSGGTAAQKFGQTYAEIVEILSTALQKYDDLDKSQWDFSPIAPLYRCPQ